MVEYERENRGYKNMSLTDAYYATLEASKDLRKVLETFDPHGNVRHALTNYYLNERKKPGEK